MRTGYWKLVWHQIRRPRLFLRDHHRLIFRLHLSISFDSKSIRPKDWSTDIMSFDDPWRMIDYLRRGFNMILSTLAALHQSETEPLIVIHHFENPADSFFKQSSFNLLNVISIEIAKNYDFNVFWLVGFWSNRNSPLWSRQKQSFVIWIKSLFLQISGPAEHFPSFGSIQISIAYVDFQMTRGSNLTKNKLFLHLKILS